MQQFPRGGKASSHGEKVKILGQEIMKLRDEINQLETKRTIRRINTTKSCVLEKNNIDKPLSYFITAIVITTKTGHEGKRKG